MAEGSAETDSDLYEKVNNKKQIQQKSMIIPFSGVLFVTSEQNQNSEKQPIICFLIFDL